MKMYHFLRKVTRKFGQSIMLVIMILTMLVAGCGSSGAATVKPQVQENGTKVQDNVYEVTRAVYTDRAITINYPQISKMNDAEKEQRLNEILKAEALSILQDYSKDELEKLTVKLDYVIGRQNAEMLSVRFTGSRFLKGTAYPTALFQSVNLEMHTGRKLRLQDMIQVDEKFMQAMKKGNIIYASENVTYEKLRVDNNKLLKALGQADSVISSENPERAFSYFTKDGIGISFSVSHAAGDHVEFERSILLLKDHAIIKPEKAYLFK